MNQPPSYDAATEDKKFEAPYTAGGQPAFAPGYPPQYGTAPSAPEAGYGMPQPQPTGYPQPSGYAPAQPAMYYQQGSAAVYQPEPAQPYNAHPAHSGGETGGFSTGGSFSDKNVRRVFIRKVFLLLSLQLLVTFGIVCVFTFVDSIKTWLRANPGWYYAAYGVFLVLYIVLVCVESARRKHPINLIMLSVFTLALSYMTGTIAAFYNTQAVITALGVTAIVCFTVMLFSIQTRFDFTKCSGLLFVLVMVLFLFGFITIFTYRYNWYLHIVYGCLGALVFTLFLAFDTQLVMGGRKHELDPEEYVYGALTLYIDIVYIFLFILSIFGAGDG